MMPPRMRAIMPRFYDIRFTPAALHGAAHDARRAADAAITMLMLFIYFRRCRR